MSEPLHILMTGGTGFIGGHLLAQLVGDGHQIDLLTRCEHPPQAGVRAVHAVGDLGANAIPTVPVRGADLLIHLAGHVKVRSNGPLEESHNVRMARTVAGLARKLGIRKVLVLSSIAVSVVEHQPELARRHGHEKRVADDAFRDLLDPEQSVVFIRPPAVYGPGMTNALMTLAGLVRLGLPLPFGLATAPRNYISVTNLASLLSCIAAAAQPAWDEAHGQSFAPDDGAPVATDRLVRMMAAAMGRKAWLLPVPLGVLRLAGRLPGRAEMVSGAIDGLDLADNSPLSRIFGWTPGQAMPESLSFLGLEGQAVDG